MRPATRRRWNAPYPATATASGRFVTLYNLGLFLSGIGLIGMSSRAMALGSLAAAIGYGMRDVLKPERDSITPMTLYALVFGVWCGLAHVISPFTVGTVYERLFYYDGGEMPYRFVAQIIATLNVVVPLIAYDAMKGLFAPTGSLGRFFPTVSVVVTPRTMALGLVTLLLVDCVMRVTGSNLGLTGTVRGIAALGTVLFAFGVVWDWLDDAPILPRWTRWLVVIAVPATSLYSFLYGFMRTDVAMPVAGVCLAIVMRKRFSRRYVAAVLAGFVFVALTYHAMAESRGGPRGTVRFTLAAESGDLTSSFMTLAARGDQYHVLSHVVDLTETEGYFEGSTLAYLFYAFIPRMIWPNKPLIVPGQWFAGKIGHGTVLPDGRVTNAVNMTMGGEFFLNFGWLGTVIGLCGFAATFALLWPTTAFFVRVPNLTGQLFGVTMLLQVLQPAFASTIFQALFTYILLQVVRWAVRAILQARGEAERPVFQGAAAPYARARPQFPPRRPAVRR